MEQRICDYEGSRYRTEFWEGQGRAYEDAVERVALRKLIPLHGQRLLEIGAGYGRLVDLYHGYQQVILTDYARTQLQEAHAYLGDDPRLRYASANIYQLPFPDNHVDVLVMIRVMHHLTDVPAALAELYRVLKPGGVAVLEYANRCNLKAILRWLVGGQAWSPFDHAPIEFVELNFNFHPAWMRQQLQTVGFTVAATRTVSHYRMPLFKRYVPLDWLVWLDSWAQNSGDWWQLTPSVFVRVEK